jgi:hypothetical protein
VTFETRHWQRFNILRRLFSLMLMVFGVSALIAGIGLEVGFPAPTSSLGRFTAPVTFGLGLVCVYVSVIMMRRRPFRPDLGDISMWAGRAGGYDPTTARGSEPRSWWTGDQEPTHHDHDA